MSLSPVCVEALTESCRSRLFLFAWKKTKKVKQPGDSSSDGGGDKGRREEGGQCVFQVHYTQCQIRCRHWWSTQNTSILRPSGGDAATPWSLRDHTRPSLREGALRVDLQLKANTESNQTFPVPLSSALRCNSWIVLHGLFGNGPTHGLICLI